MNYYITNPNKDKFNKIKERIRQMDVKMYDAYKCHPVYVISIHNNGMLFNNKQKIIVFEGEEVSPIMRLLGFSFDGLYDDWNKRVTEIEKFGKYCCEIYTNHDINIDDYIYTKEPW